MNKNGKTSGMNLFLIVVSIVLIALVGMTVFGNPLKQSVLGGNTPGTGNSGGTNIITTGATYSVIAQDAQALGTSVGVTSQVSVASAENPTKFSNFGSAASSYSPGQVLNILLTNGTVYHATYIANHIVPAATSDVIQASMNANATVTEVVNYPYTGLNLNNGGGASNITGAATLKTFQLTDTMYGTALQSTQDMTCIVELTAGTNATTTPAGVSLTGAGVTVDALGSNTPAWYSTAGSSSRTWAFSVPALTSSNALPLTLTVNVLPTATMSAGNKVVKTCYTKEWFIDSNTGKATYGVADSNNVVKSMAKYTYTAYFQN